jgi:hypothetical protein
MRGWIRRGEKGESHQQGEHYGYNNDIKIKGARNSVSGLEITTHRKKTRI